MIQLNAKGLLQGRRVRIGAAVCGSRFCIACRLRREKSEYGFP